jgi:Patatin-like phospholipase
MRADRVTVCLLAAMVLAGCAGPVRKNAVPKTLTTQATVPGLADVRYRAGIDRDAFMREGIESFYREQAYLASRGHQGPMPPAVYLAVSGGGDNGAFGAGLLNGWTAAGNRPEFKLVTGVSTGALIAPFAFLGPAYDDKLKKVYTTITPKDILTRAPFWP